MSDYDIVIKLDPGQPVQSAARVTEAVAKVEQQSEKAQEAVAGLGEKLKKQAESTSELSKKWSELSKAMLGQALNDTFRRVSDGAKEATGGIIDLNGAFAGYQAAGPWGAAIGAVAVPLAKTANLVDAMGVSLDELEAKAQKHVRGFMPELTAEVWKEHDAIKAMNDRLLETPAALANVFTEFAKLYPLLAKVREQIQAFDSLPARINRGFGAAGKGLQDFIGDAVNRYLGVSGWNPLKYKTGGDRTYNNGVSPLDAYSGGQPRSSYLGLGEAAGVDGLEQLDLAKLAQDTLSEKIKANADETLQLAANTRKWNEELVQTNITAQIVSDVLNKAASSFADTLVDAANGADVSWREWGANMLVMIEKIIAQALVLKAIGSSTGGIGGGGTGLLGLLFGGAHATGGSYTAPATGGGADSIPVMFRMSPRETATFTPHGQAFGGSAVGGPGTLNLTVAPQIHDERAIQSAMASPNGQRVIYNVVRQALGAIRPLG